MSFYNACSVKEKYMRTYNRLFDHRLRNEATVLSWGKRFLAFKCPGRPDTKMFYKMIYCILLSYFKKQALVTFSFKIFLYIYSGFTSHRKRCQTTGFRQVHTPRCGPLLPRRFWLLLNFLAACVLLNSSGSAQLHGRITSNTFSFVF